MTFAVVRTPIDAAAIESAVRSRTCGATVTFTGIVRERADDGRNVTGLSYEAYEDMAVSEFERIAGEAQERFGACRIAVVHRVGELAVGDVAVAVVAASEHRALAFDACRYVIDELKSRAPIWKQEHYADGASEWKQNDCRSAAH